MDLLQLREKEIFNTLKKLAKTDFVIIGGYAVNAYTLPRFSVDCDIVTKEKSELEKIEKELFESGYSAKDTYKVDSPYHGEFMRYEKVLEHNFNVSVDIFFKDILDRQTNASFRADWVFQNSGIGLLRGKTIKEDLKLRIINLDALVVMKMISCRITDIRDVFMLFPNVKDIEWIKNEVSVMHNFNDRIAKVKKEISSEQFRDNLQGIYGYIDDKIFNKHRDSISKI